MASVAEQLRTAREKQSLTLRQLADKSNIRADHLLALEEGRYEIFSAPVYIRGFVRTYAGLLKMDVPAVIATLDQELGKTAQFREHPRLSGKRRSVADLIMLQLSRVNWRIVMPFLILLIGVGIVFAGVRFWQSRQSADPLKNLGTGLYQPRSNQGGAFIPLTNPTPVMATNRAAVTNRTTRPAIRRNP